MNKAILKQAALIGALVLSTAVATAKVATINDITIDVPDGYKISSSNRGILAKTPDGEVDVWVESYKADELPTLLKEHDRYWNKQKVALNGDADRVGKTSGDIPITTSDYTKAVWKGDPTVLRYTSIGPIGPKKAMVLITYWASPSDDKEYNAEIQETIGTLNVKIDQ